MLLLNQDARRLIGKASGRFERQLIDIAEMFAEEEGATSVSVGHVHVAVKSLAGDNASLLLSLLDATRASHVERRAG